MVNLSTKIEMEKEIMEHVYYSKHMGAIRYADYYLPIIKNLIKRGYVKSRDGLTVITNVAYHYIEASLIITDTGKEYYEELCAFNEL